MYDFYISLSLPLSLDYPFFSASNILFANVFSINAMHFEWIQSISLEISFEM